MIPPTRWLPMPILSVLLLVVWLLLQHSVALGQWLLGGVLAIAIPLVCRPFWERQPTIKRPWRLFLYVLRVLGDIVTANLQVSKLILDPRGRMRPAFVEYPLTLKENFPITILASTITMTPGTVSAHLRLDGRTLLIHALDVSDINELIDEIHQRYERPLMEIFES
ncbi:Na+/H+ antiporter subunit E [Salinicola rhizosphaerae]|uniref:Monovalent cation/H+ antiporter subunit E n=1 Tax=Salinicola rhizosphaerae TaxID=1443141 RepID=A0ABQ3DU77_9GAMM|nr:Na+/H+ antiporter subunit E [Salinicola rhizosphaerae]GHB16648.1 monovalent cation/H+ antiporter subunit E [Salinicola rhizosphaerae]